ncbi:hypothetical protein ACLKA7_007745 [Drosophila subpalustris]
MRRVVTPCLSALCFAIKQQQLQQNFGSNPSSTSYRMLEQVAAPAVAADCGRDPHDQHDQQLVLHDPDALKCRFHGTWILSRRHLETCDNVLEYLFFTFLNNCRHHCLQRITKTTLMGHSRGSMWVLPILQKNTHLNQQQQQQQLRRPSHPHPVSNCQHHGSGEAWRRHPTPHGQVSIKQLIGYWCPSWASGSHHHHHDHHQPVQQQQQQRLQRLQQRSNWPIHMPLVWPLRQPQMHMGASAVLLLLAIIQLMLIWGIT